MAKQKLPYVTPEMLKTQPSQFCALINRIIEKLNAL